MAEVLVRLEILVLLFLRGGRAYVLHGFLYYITRNNIRACRSAFAAVLDFQISCPVFLSGSWRAQPFARN